MQVTLVVPENDVEAHKLTRAAWVAARTCYSAKTPQELWDESATRTTEEMGRWLAEKIVAAGHWSVLHHVKLTFLVTGISRACLDQLARHKVGVAADVDVNPEVQSQRYVAYRRDVAPVAPPTIREHPEAHEAFRDTFAATFARYRLDLDLGIPPEDARYHLPMAFPTNLVYSTNLSAFLHLCGERLCTLAQWEIRQLVNQMRKAVVRRLPWVKPYATVKCLRLGYCPEPRNQDGHCRVRPYATPEQVRAALVVVTASRTTDE